MRILGREWCQEADNLCIARLEPDVPCLLVHLDGSEAVSGLSRTLRFATHELDSNGNELCITGFGCCVQESAVVFVIL